MGRRGPARSCSRSTSSSRGASSIARRSDVERLLEARRRLPELLDLLERHRIAATFAVVGHLFLEGCDGHPGCRGRSSGSDRRTGWEPTRGPTRTRPRLVCAVARAAHPRVARGPRHRRPRLLARAARRARLRPRGRCLRGRRRAPAALRGVGLRPDFFVFPRNGIKYRELLAREGFACYRAVERRWYHGRSPAVRKAAHMLDQALAITPSTGLPQREGGLVEIPSSMLFLSREGFRRHLPLRARVVRALRGLERATRTRRGLPPVAARRGPGPRGTAPHAGARCACSPR